MLVLSLRVNESIVVSGEAEIMVTSLGVRNLKLTGGHVKLGITASQHVRIRRARRLAGRTLAWRKS